MTETPINSRYSDIAWIIDHMSDAIMSDTSHANYGKDDTKVPSVYREIIRQPAAGYKKLVGAMVVSHLVAGNQKFPQPLEDLTYGHSITDKCVDCDSR